MTNWYKNNVKIDFEKRNMLNHQIRAFDEMSDSLIKLSKIVFQSATTAKENNLKLINDKFLSSYPIIRDILIEADQFALDSPWKFSGLLKEAQNMMIIKIGNLKQERKDLLDQGSNKNKKGWF